MHKKNNLIRNISIVAGAVIIIALVFWLIKRSTSLSEVLIKTKVEQGSFISEVYSTGQLQAENATFIEVPTELSSRNINIFEIKVTDIVEEGTVVKEGDFVASLDHSAIEEILTTAREELEKELQEFEDARIDTNINMSNLRDALLNSRVAVEEKKLVLDQSKYESPAVKRQAALDLERADQNLEQEIRNYELKQRQARHSVSRAMEDVRRDRERVTDIEALFEALNVKAPKPGMVIYSFDRFGTKIKVGSSVSRWAPRIAELPDLSTMISKTFINEIDISKISVGQKVKVGVDAFPEKSFDGEVISVANIGQVLPNGDTKVFEVTIKLFGTDSQLRPAMTTSNVITTDSLSAALFIPLDAVFKTDSTKYVYTYTNEWVKQIVDLGVENANFVVVNKGLVVGQEVLLNEPAESDKFTLVGVDIYEEIQVRNKKAAEEELKKKEDSLKNQELLEQSNSGDKPEGKERSGGRNGERRRQQQN
jgi:multidrug efflux pump subunit AcrA (membrane-fusion protein)